MGYLCHRWIQHCTSRFVFIPDSHETIRSRALFSSNDIVHCHLGNGLTAMPHRSSHHPAVSLRDWSPNPVGNNGGGFVLEAGHRARAGPRTPLVTAQSGIGRRPMMRRQSRMTGQLPMSLIMTMTGRNTAARPQRGTDLPAWQPSSHDRKSIYLVRRRHPPRKQSPPVPRPEQSVTW